MRKISEEVENPIDNLVLKYTVDTTHKYYKKLNFTPNMITILSLFSGVLAAYYFYLQNFVVASLLFALAYYFDCMDGYYARQYNMQSKFGDVLDHLCDIFKFTLLLFVMFKLNSKKALYITIFLLILGFASVVHLGCQQKYYHKDNTDDLYIEGEEKILNLAKKTCKNEDWIKYTKFVGTGTFITIVCLIILFWNKI